MSIIIIGGGMVGLSMGILLAKQNIKTTLIDRQPIQTNDHIENDGRASAIAYGSYEIFKRFDVWPFLEKHAGPILDIRVTDQDATQHLHYDHQLVGEHPMGYMIHNQAIQQGLFACAKTLSDLTILPETAYQLVERKKEGVTVTLDNGDKLDAQLLIAADGRRSNLRKLAGISVVEKNYHQTAIICSVKHEKHHQYVAQERFLAPGPFAVLPLADGFHSSLVWTEKTAIAPHFLAMKKEEMEIQIQQRMTEYLGQVTLASPCFSYPLNMIRSHHYISDRLALIGDAAHGIHPLAGQGFNLAIRGAACLADLAAEYRECGLDLGSTTLLKRYEKQRFFDSDSLIAITTGLNHLFSNQLFVYSAARRFGLSVVNRLPLLKKQFMRHAMGNETCKVDPATKH